MEVSLYSCLWEPTDREINIGVTADLRVFHEICFVMQTICATQTHNSRPFTHLILSDLTRPCLSDYSACNYKGAIWIYVHICSALRVFNCTTDSNTEIIYKKQTQGILRNISTSCRISVVHACLPAGWYYIVHTAKQHMLWAHRIATAKCQCQCQYQNHLNYVKPFKLIKTT